MSTEENKAIARRHIKEVLEQGRVDLIDSYYAPDGSEEMPTPEQWRDIVLWHHKVTPGFKASILDMMAEGDKVMTHTQVDITYSSQFTSEYSDPFPPLDKPVTWTNLDVMRIVDGKLIAMRNVFG